MKKTVFCMSLTALITVSAVFAAPAQEANLTPEANQNITVRLLTDATGIDDKSFNTIAWRGILEFYGDSPADTRLRGRYYDWVTAQSQDFFEPNLRQATDEGYDLIVSTGFLWAGAMSRVAGDNPNQRYLLVDVGGVNLPNVMRAVYAEHEGSFLVGAAAALKAKADGIVNPRFGFIGGVPSAVITKFEVGFIQGVLSVIPDAQFVDYYVNSFGDPALAKAQAMNWYDSGVYAIYSAAGGSGNGTIAQAKEYRFAGRNVWAIGVDSDQYEEGIYRGTESAVLTSMIKRVDISVIYALNAVKNNTFRGEVVTFDLKADGVGYSDANPTLDRSIIEQLEVLKKQIADGNIQIASTYAEARRLPGFPQDLRALDD